MKYSRVHRLLRLIVQINGCPNLNASRLAELCEMSVRHIYRDIKMLQAAGVPVSFDRDAGGYSIRRDFFLRPVDLTLEEAMALLLLAERIGAPEQIPHAAEAGKAAEKLRAILPRQISEMINDVMPRVSVSLARSSNEPTADVYSAMRDAISRRRALECQYESPSRQPTQDPDIFRFDPYALYFGQRAWYAVGLHHGRDEIRTLKLSRFTRRNPLDKPYMIPDDFSLERHFGQAHRMMPSNTGSSPARPETPLHPRLRRNRRRHPLARQPGVTQWQDDGSLLMTFRIEGLEEVLWWILSYGPNCQVLEPPELARRVADLARSTAEQYGRE